MRLISTLLLGLCTASLCSPALAHSLPDRAPEKRVERGVDTDDELHHRLERVSAEMNRRLLAMLRPATLICLDRDEGLHVAQECETVFEIDADASRDVGESAR